MHNSLSYLVIDTETSGLFKFRDADGKPVPADAPGQPRLASVAFIYVDPGMSVISEREFLIKPDGWSLDAGAAAVNGLTMERLEAEGVPVGDVLDLYTDAINDSRVVLAFNAQFDTKMMRGELRRAGRPDLFDQTKNICAMRACDGIVIKPDGGRGWPKLTHACAHFNIEQQDQHTALGDARACLEVFKHLVAIGAAPEPAVHLANASKSGVKPSARRGTKTKTPAPQATDEIPT